MAAKRPEACGGAHCSCLPVDCLLQGVLNMNQLDAAKFLNMGITTVKTVVGCRGGSPAHAKPARACPPLPPCRTCALSLPAHSEPLLPSAPRPRQMMPRLGLKNWPYRKRHTVVDCVSQRLEVGGRSGLALRRRTL